MLIFNKLLPVFVLPLGWVFLCLGFALWRKKRWPIGAATAILYVCGIRATSDLTLGALESRYQPLRVADAQTADAIVVLGGIFGPPTAEGFIPNLLDSGERLEAGIALMNHGRARKLVFTGGRLPWNDTAEVEGERARRFALARGIAPEQILVTGVVRNTVDEAAAIASLMKAEHWTQVILVTTAWHMPRAARLFRKAEVDFEAFPVDYRCSPHKQLHLLDFVPNGEALAMTELGLREMYGLAFYVATGR